MTDEQREILLDLVHERSGTDTIGPERIAIRAALDTIDASAAEVARLESALSSALARERGLREAAETIVKERGCYCPFASHDQVTICGFCQAIENAASALYAPAPGKDKQ